MKILRSKKMKQLLAKEKRIAARRSRIKPSDGMLAPLFSETAQNGWYYQIDWINDSRFAPKPWIEVFAFSPRAKQRGTACATNSLRSDN